MAEAIIWVYAILSIVLVFFAGHFTLTKILPPLKRLLGGLFKDEKVVNPLMSLLIILVGVLVLNKTVEVLVGLENEIVNIVTILTPALDVLMQLLPYVGYLVLGWLIILGLDSFRS